MTVLEPSINVLGTCLRQQRVVLSPELSGLWPNVEDIKNKAAVCITYRWKCMK